MAWFKRSYFKLKFFFKEFTNLIYMFIIDLKSVYYDFKKIKKTPIYFILIFPVLLIVQIWLFFFIIIFLFFNVYYLFYFYYNIYFFKFNKYNYNNPYNFGFKKYNFNNITIQHLFYFFFKLPQMLSFKVTYIFLKNIHFKKQNLNLASILILLFIIPFRFYIKLITGFSYISIKISLILICNFIGVLKFDYENYNAVYDNFMCNLYVSYINPILKDVNNYNIYWDNKKIVFNPFEEKILKIFKDLPSLKKSLFFSNKLFELRFIETSKISGHPSFISFINETNFKELTAVIQSSKVFRPILNGENKIIKDKADVKILEGVLGKQNVYDHRPVTIDLIKNSIKLKSIDDWNNIIDPDLQKKIAIQTLYVSFYKKDLILNDGQVQESIEFDLYIERLYALYKNKELTNDAYESLSYLLEFSEVNDIAHNTIKQKLWNYLFENAVIDDNNIIIPDFDNKNLPLDLKNMLELFD